MWHGMICQKVLLFVVTTVKIWYVHSFIFILTCRSKYIDIGHLCLSKYINFYGINLLEYSLFYTYAYQ
jgi:hypothetical protein